MKHKIQSIIIRYIDEFWFIALVLLTQIVDKRFLILFIKGSAFRIEIFSRIEWIKIVGIIQNLSETIALSFCPWIGFMIGMEYKDLIISNEYICKKNK
ncbi:MAG: hypothetical protein PHP90_03515 [Sulfuricurvum sp.]|uniref:hypothetical protein n=1 Tax=Sulfuricurvum sp. TaxID=2025608 RepID=UPI0026218CE5|nr:hypothetical protein [Sulfuricurvum sp.]MDD5117634.1 hypothetical protein [Sulfuricurvum sp.]